jgi:hypothetical protein
MAMMMKAGFGVAGVSVLAGLAAVGGDRPCNGAMIPT